MAKLAKHYLKHGKDDGEILSFEPGDEVKGVPKEVREEWEEAGLLAEDEEELSEDQSPNPEDYEAGSQADKDEDKK